uniref:Uncharacterized protein n=1 Tax=viral metagenome TaxID=1070528 RepID=A0A6M3L6H7_9ZZZZ
MTTEEILHRLEDMQTEHELLMDDVRFKGEGISDDTRSALDILWHDIMNAISDITEGKE